jgi:hypothetical protein
MIRTVHRLKGQVATDPCVCGIGHQEIFKEQRRKLVKGEFTKSLEPSIKRDMWRAVSISLTRDSKESTGKVLRTHDSRNRDRIWAIGSIKVVDLQSEASSFQDFRDRNI